jgi:thioredoxin 2
MSSVVQITCPHCGTTNRVPGERLGDGPTCGKCKQALFDGHPTELDEASFDRMIGQTEIPVVVDFWAPWCGPCRMMAPHFERAARTLEPQARLAKLNTEVAQSIAARYGIQSIPTLIVFKNGREAARRSGALDAGTLTSWVRSVA